MPTYFRDIVPTEHLTYRDLRGEPSRLLKIRTVQRGEYWNLGKRKPCLLIFFDGLPKGLRVGATINTQVAHVCGYGEDADRWAGKWVDVFVTTDDKIKGPDQTCLRVRKPDPEAIRKLTAAAGGAAPAPARPASPATPPAARPAPAQAAVAAQSGQPAAPAVPSRPANPPAPEQGA